jgi:hypothetical protein
MLKIILGTAGSGKTAMLLEIMATDINLGRNCVAYSGEHEVEYLSLRIRKGLLDRDTTITNRIVCKHSPVLPVMAFAVKCDSIYLDGYHIDPDMLDLLYHISKRIGRNIYATVDCNKTDGEKAVKVLDYEDYKYGESVSADILYNLTKQAESDNAIDWFNGVRGNLFKNLVSQAKGRSYRYRVDTNGSINTQDILSLPEVYSYFKATMENLEYDVECDSSGIWVYWGER